MPYQRVGICQGERCRNKRTWSEVPLYRVGDMFRYRCRTCFKRETRNYSITKESVMPAALQIVQSMFPKVKHIVNAKKGIALTVNERDVKSATKKDHNGCAMAVACKRELGVDGAIISTRTAYIVDGDTATRYAVGHTVNREITSLDRGAGFAPGDYTLQRPQSVAPRGSGTRHAGDPGPGTLRHKTYHHVEGTRDTLHSLLPAPKRKSKRR